MRSWVQLDDPGYMPICNGYNGVPNSDCYEKEEASDDDKPEKKAESTLGKAVQNVPAPTEAPIAKAAKSFAQLSYDPNEVPLPFCNKYNGNNCRPRNNIDDNRETSHKRVKEKTRLDLRAHHHLS
jgi:hypothetical protein